MTTEIQIFRNEKFGEFRTAEINGNIYFAGSDIAKVLGYSNPQKAVIDHCREDGITIREVTDSLGRSQDMKFISEGNLYRLIIKSQMPEADKFEKYIFDEVLPSIRKHGGYLTPAKTEELLNNPDLIIQLATSLKEERAKIKFQQVVIDAQASKINLDAPKVIFADAVAISKDSILIGQLAKYLKQNGIDIGQNRLFKILRDSGYLCVRGDSYNLPTQKAMEMGLFEIKESTVINPDGSVRITRTTKVTGKGQIYFVNKFLNNHRILAKVS